MQVDAAAGQVHRRSRRHRAVLVEAGRVHALADVVIEVEFDGDALRNERHGGGRTVAKRLARRAKRRGRVVLQGKGEAVRLRIRELECKVRAEGARTYRRIPEDAGRLEQGFAGQLQPIVAGPGRAAVQAETGNAGKAAAEVDAGAARGDRELRRGYRAGRKTGIGGDSVHRHAGGNADSPAIDLRAGRRRGAIRCVIDGCALVCDRDADGLCRRVDAPRGRDDRCGHLGGELEAGARGCALQVIRRQRDGGNCGAGTHLKGPGVECRGAAWNAAVERVVNFGGRERVGDANRLR